MNDLESVLRGMTLEFFGSGKHKINLEVLFQTKGGVFLDVRSIPEQETIQLTFKHHNITVLHIPIDEIPDRIDEVHRDGIVAVFCSAGTRSAIVYAYLRSLGYENVRLAIGGHEAVTNLMLPGELLKHIG